MIEPRDDVALIPGYHSPQLDVKVRLNTNEAPVPPPVEFVQRLRDELTRVDWHRYPDRGAHDLRAAIASLHGVEPEQVFAANGSNEVLQTLCLTYGGAGRSVAVFEPTYALHSHIARITGTAVAEGERRDDFTLDMREVHRVLDGARPAITYLCSPNNPTGLVESPAVLDAAVDASNGLVVVDEAYGQFSPWSALSLRGGANPGLVVTRTFSKTWALAGARLGYLVADPAVVAACEAVVLPYHLSAQTQAAGLLALRHVPEMEARVARITEERGRVAAALRDLPVDSWPSDANFILFRPRERDADEVWDSLLSHSVLIRNCASWEGLKGCLRVTIGTAEENERFLHALKESL